MRYSLEILENKTFYYQTVSQRLKHGALGKVLIEANLKTVKKIINENN